MAQPSLLSQWSAIIPDRWGQRGRCAAIEPGTLASSSTITVARFAAIRGSAANLRPFALRSLEGRLCAGIEPGTLASSSTITFARFAAIRGSAANSRLIRVEIFGRPTMCGHRTGNIGMFLYVYLRKIRGHLRERSGFAAIRVGIFGRLTGSRVSKGEHWLVPLHFGSQDSRLFAGAQRICVGISAPILKDHEWALIGTNFLGYAASLFVTIRDHSWSK